MSKIKLIECITTWQGEGPDTGKYMLLCRFKKCQMNCPFCDTMVQMNNSVEGEYSLEHMQKAIDDIAGGLMITGGEPTLYLNEVNTLLTNLKYSVANIETNGYKLKELMLQTPEDLNVKFIFSPKHKLKQDDIWHFRNDKRIYYKFVIDRLDTDKFSMHRQSLDMLMKHYANMTNVFLMPKGITPQELKHNSKIVFDLAEQYKCNISTRMHLIYNFY